MTNLKLFDSNRLKRRLKRKNASTANSAVKTMCAPGFPLYYVLRNLAWLNHEKWWTTLSYRAKRTRASKIVGARIAFFYELKKMRKALKGVQIPVPGEAPAYCNKCGLCCEVASGMPDFPSPSPIPARWRQMFANGLGQGHRFCPFLWEDNVSGGGLCSIYPHRSNPCRLFGSEECDFFRKSDEPAELSNPRKIMLMGRWLIKLVNPRQLPLTFTDIAAERPEFLEFHRV